VITGSGGHGLAVAMADGDDAADSSRRSGQNHFFRSILDFRSRFGSAIVAHGQPPRKALRCGSEALNLNLLQKGGVG